MGALSYADTPGIWSQEQVEGWKNVTKAVHDGGLHLAAALARGTYLAS